MWPYLVGSEWFGSEWLWDAVLSAALVAVVAAIAVRAASRREPAGNARAAQDRIQRIWHAHEQGDLTEWEFARLISPRQTTYERRWPAMMVAGPAGETLVPHDVAAD